MTDQHVSKNTPQLHPVEVRKRTGSEFRASVQERQRTSSGPVWDVMFRVDGRQRSRTFTSLDSATRWRDLYALSGPRVALRALEEPEPGWLDASEEGYGEIGTLEVSAHRTSPLYTAAGPLAAVGERDPKAMFDDAPLLSTLSEAAVSLKVSRGHLLKLVESGEVVGVKVGKAWLVPRRALLLRVEENRARRSGAGAPRRELVAAGIAAELLRELDDLADSKSVTSLLRVSQRTLGDLTRGGTLPGIKEGGTNWTYSSRELVGTLVSSIPGRASSRVAATPQAA